MDNKINPSEEFLQACERTVHSGGSVRICDLCGRTTFNSTGGWDWEPGELEELQKHAKESPNRYIDVEYSVQSIEIDCKECVIGCQCDGLYKYEKLFWNNRELIARYFQNRADLAAKRAREIMKTANTTTASINDIHKPGNIWWRFKKMLHG